MATIEPNDNGSSGNGQPKPSNGTPKKKAKASKKRANGAKKNGKKPVNSRTQKTLKKADDFLKKLAVHGVKAAAARESGLSRSTVHKLEQEDPEFKAAVEQAERKAIAELEVVGMACAVKAKTNPKYIPALIFALKAKAGWRDHTTIDVNIQKVGQIEYIDIAPEDVALKKVD